MQQMQAKNDDLERYKEIVGKALQVPGGAARYVRASCLTCVVVQEERALEALALQQVAAPKTAARR